MAKAVPVRVTLSEQAVNMACLRKSLEVLHMHVVAEVVQGETYSEQQVAALLIAMRKKLLENGMTKKLSDAPLSATGYLTDYLT